MAADGLSGLFGLDGVVGEVVTDFAGLLPCAGGGMEAPHDTLEPNDGYDSAAPGGTGDDGSSIEDRRDAGFAAVPFAPVHSLED